MLFFTDMAPKVRRLAIMGKPSVAQLQQGAVHVRESKLRKALEKDEAKGWISIKKKMKKKKEDKKKVDKEKEVVIFIFLSDPPPLLLTSQVPKKIKKEEDPESILKSLISMLSGSSLPSLTFSSSVQRESEETKTVCRWLQVAGWCSAGRAAGGALCAVGAARTAGWCPGRRRQFVQRGRCWRRRRFVQRGFPKV